MLNSLRTVHWDKFCCDCTYIHRAWLLQSTISFSLRGLPSPVYACCVLSCCISFTHFGSLVFIRVGIHSCLCCCVVDWSYVTCVYVCDWCLCVFAWSPSPPLRPCPRSWLSPQSASLCFWRRWLQNQGGYSCWLLATSVHPLKEFAMHAL